MMRLLLWSFRHRKGRRVIDIVTMAVTASVVMVFITVLLGLVLYVKKSSETQLTRVLIKQKMIDTDLPMAFYQTLKDIPGVEVVERYKVINAKHKSGAKYLVISEEESGIANTPDLLPVEPEVFEAWKKKRPMGTIVTEEIANELGLKVGDVREITTSAGPLRIEVVGISYGATLAQRIAPHFEYVMEFLKNPGTCRFRVYTKPGDYERVARAIEETSKNSGQPVQAINAAHFAATHAKEAGMVPAVLGFLGIFLIFTAALTLANNAAISVRERRTETATLRVLGYRRRTIMALLLAEALIVGVVGGLIAILVTWFTFRNGVQLTPGATQVLGPVTLGTSGIIAGIITSILLPIVGTLPSALAAMRISVVDALRDTA